MPIILQIWDNFYLISLHALSKKTQNNIRVSQDSQLSTPIPTPRPRKIIENLTLASKSI